MNKYLPLMLLLFLALTLSSCDYSTNSNLNLSMPELSISIPMENNTTTSNVTKEVNISMNLSNNNEVVQAGQDISELLMTINATEGDLIKLNIQAYDPDNDEVTIFYGEPFNDQGLWQTHIGDAGVYLVKVIASDGKSNTTGYVRVIVNKANRPPVINCPQDVYTVKEGETFTLDCSFFDEEDDPLIVSYSGWMHSKQKDVGYNEQGTHKVWITVNDGKHRVTKELTINVINVNRPPVLIVYNIEAVEGDIVVIKYNVSDPDEDNVSVSFSEPFNNEGVWQTSIGDAGVYEVTIAASDGKAVVEKKINVTIKMRNTPPIIKAPDVIDVNEGEQLKLPVDYYDREDKSLLVTISGWMNSTSRYVDYNEQGTHTVTITVSDGQYTVSKTITIIVHDVNRPPVFIHNG